MTIMSEASGVAGLLIGAFLKSAAQSAGLVLLCEGVLFAISIAIFAYLVAL